MKPLNVCKGIQNIPNLLKQKDIDIFKYQIDNLKNKFPNYEITQNLMLKNEIIEQGIHLEYNGSIDINEIKFIIKLQTNSNGKSKDNNISSFIFELLVLMELKYVNILIFVLIGTVKNKFYILLNNLKTKKLMKKLRSKMFLNNQRKILKEIDSFKFCIQKQTNLERMIESLTTSVTFLIKYNLEKIKIEISKMFKITKSKKFKIDSSRLYKCFIKDPFYFKNNFNPIFEKGKENEKKIENFLILKSIIKCNQLKTYRKGRYCSQIPFLFSKPDAVLRKNIYEFKSLENLEDFRSWKNKIPKFVTFQLEAQAWCFKTSEITLIVFYFEQNEIKDFFIHKHSKNYNFVNNYLNKISLYTIKYIIIPKICKLKECQIEMIEHEKLEEIKECLKNEIYKFFQNHKE